MVGMVLGMADAGDSHKPVHQHEAEQQGPDECGSCHVQCPTNLLLERRRLDGLRVLDTGHGITDDLLGQEPALDVLTNDAFFIDKHADR